MEESKRIILNTFAQYTRTIINTCLSLYATRLILAALGETDYGIYSVVGGVVAMLSFVTNALVSTTQRYLSFHHGASDKEKIYGVFGNSVLLHFLIAGILILLLSALSHPVLHSMLHIEPERLSAAHGVYAAMVVMLGISFITAPFRATFIARENIVFISIIDVLEGVSRLLIAILLTYEHHFDKLILYAVLMCCVSLFSFLSFAVYALYHYEECHFPRLREWDMSYIRGLSGFAGWTMYSTGCIVARTQGIAVLLNRFFGSALNAAYGIALQVNGATAFIAQSIANSMSPQIIKAAGQGKQSDVLLLSELASKYAVCLFGLVAIPMIAEMDTLLQIWLGNPPEYSTVFCQFILVSCLCDQLTMGLTIANQATGKIKYYSLIINTVKLLTLPAAWLCLHYGLNSISVMWCYLIFECLCAIIRLPYIKIVQGLSIRHYVKTVISRVVIPIALSSVFCLMMVKRISCDYRILITAAGSALLYIPSCYYIVLDKKEQNTLKHILKI